MKTKSIVITAILLFVWTFITPSVQGQMIAGGSDHSLAVCADSTVSAWGEGVCTGDGTLADKLTPGQVSNLNSVIGVAAGYVHSLALKADRTVWAWGNNASGQLGDGTLTEKLTPIQVNDLFNIIAIVVAGNSSFALKGNGTIWAWGYNGYGQLGDSSTISKPIPSQISGLSGIISISASHNHTLALKSDGNVWSWGDNFYGQLGDGTKTNRLTPIQITGLTGIIAIAAGGNFSFALKSDGTVWAWGKNGEGALGDGTGGDKLTPVLVPGLNEVTAIAAGFHHCIALKKDGTVWGWGSNNAGQLADGANINPHLSPILISAGVKSIAVGDDHSLLLKNDGRLWSCGWNSNGQLGDGTTINKSVLVQVHNLCPTFRKNIISGICFLDNNKNNLQDIGEGGVRNVRVFSISSAYSFSSTTQNAGIFNNIADLNSITTKPQTVPYYIFSPSQHNSNFSSYGNTDSVSFAFVPIDTSIQDLRITLIPLNSVRVGRDVLYRIVYENVGTKTMSGSVFMKMNSGLTFVSANPSYSSINGNILEWTYSNLTPFESRSIDVTLLVPSTATIGSVLLPYAYIEPIATDSVPTDNGSALEQLVLGSYDPNDKTMLQGDDVTIQQVTNGEYLNYLIRFQNTGNDTAFTVIVRDTLDSKLDWNSFEMVSTSHDCATAIRDGKNVAWTFENILLPDSTTDEPGSHGYICYRIKAKNNLNVGDTIKNTVHIYFDFNAAVITNTVNTVVSDFTEVGKISSESDFLIYPNPASDKLTVMIRQGRHDMMKKLEIVNVLGEMMIKTDLPQSKTDIDVSFLSKGLYFVRLTDSSRSITRKVFID